MSEEKKINITFFVIIVILLLIIIAMVYKYGKGNGLGIGANLYLGRQQYPTHEGSQYAARTVTQGY